MNDSQADILNRIVPNDRILPILAVQWWNQIPELTAFKAVYGLPFVLDISVSIRQFISDSDRVIGFMHAWSKVVLFDEEAYRHFTIEEQNRILWFQKIYDFLRLSQTMSGPGVFLPTGVGMAAALMGAYAPLDDDKTTQEERVMASDFIETWARGIEDCKNMREAAFEKGRLSSDPHKPR